VVVVELCLIILKRPKLRNNTDGLISYNLMVKADECIAYGYTI
jgi:hypothetical protein